MDPVDDFEFKPLTKGLGFHKPANEKSEGLRSDFGNQDSAPQISGPKAPKTLASPNFLVDSETENDLLGREPARSASSRISELIDSLPPSLDFIGGRESDDLPPPPTPKSEPNLTLPDGVRPHIFQPLGRDEVQPARTIGSALATQKGAAQDHSTFAQLPQPGRAAHVNPPKLRPPQPASPYRERLDESFARAFPHARGDRSVTTKGDIQEQGSRQKQSQARVQKRVTERIEQKPAKAAPIEIEEASLEPVPMQFGSGVVDIMVVSGMSALLLVTIIMITHVNLIGMLSNAKTDGPTQIHLALLFIAVLQLYFLTARSFFGCSLGEWAFDMQLGSRADRLRATYPLQVGWRTLVITFAGLIIIPVLSVLFRQDLAKYFSGLQLYRRD